MQVTTPVLSICVPSRNRQIYFQATIKALTASPRTDVEFVFVDNSDDPSVMNDFIELYLGDPRVRYVSAGPVVRPMMENWEVALDATNGRWAMVIGDDDYADPEIAGLISRIEELAPDVEAIDWTKLYYTWPYEGKPILSNPVHTKSELHEVPKVHLMERAFRWENARDVLGCGFGIYHGALSRPLLDRIKALGGGRYFEHPVIDYDNIFKVIMHGKRFVHCRRPLSVMGVCPESNSAATSNPEKMREKQDIFDKEHATPMDRMACYEDFPFSSRLGLAACILMTQHWFADRYGHTFHGHERNFVNSCEIQCNKIEDQAQFDLIVNGYRRALRTWKGGKYLKYFKPVYQPKPTAPTFCGYLNDSIFVTDDHPAFDSCKSYYELTSAMIEPVADLVVDLQRYRVAPAEKRRA